MTEPIDPPDTEQMIRALDRIATLAGTLADQDITLLRAGINHADDTIRGLLDINTEQHEELLRGDLQHAIRAGGTPPPAPGPPPPGIAVPEPGTTTRWPWQNPEAA